ncbi:hypothetical protein ANO11243_042190 [Dothideomycetidae sp. 11243]|nr:hypothetical protein ANO11243_042190 [fungal sp. No.11243]
MLPILQQILSGVHTLNIVQSVGFAVSTIAVALRVYVRAFRLRSFGVDDWAIVAAYLIYVAAFAVSTHWAILTAIAVNEGALALVVSDKHTQILLSVSYALYIVDVVVLKISLGTFFLRIVKKNPVMRTIVYIILTLITLYGTVFFLLFTAGHCGVAEHSATKCSYQTQFNIVSYVWSFLSGATEFVFAIMAIVVIGRLQLPRSQKFITGALVAFGSMGGVAAIVRGYYTIRDSMKLDVSAQFLAGDWIALQMSIGLTAASLATLKPLLVSFVTMIKGSSAARVTGYTHGQTVATTTTTRPGGTISEKEGIVITNEWVTHQEDA